MADDTNVPAAPEEATVPAADLEDRIQSFNKELIPLLGKYELGLGATAALTTDGRVQARPIVFDMRGQKPAEEETIAEPAAPQATAA